MPINAAFLNTCSHFSGLSSTELDAMARLMFERTAERGEIITLEGGPAEAMFFVVSGAVKIFKTSSEGKEQILNITYPGQSFNEDSVLDGGPSLASAQAMAAVVLYGMRKNELETALNSYPLLARNIIKVLANRTRHLVSLIEDLAFKRVIGRVVKILLEYADTGSDAGPRLTQQDIAAMAGTVREVVARALKTLEDDGTIRLERHRIVILDKDALEKMAAA